ncbi:MAG: aspartate--tRNA ligase [Candidatus Gastranaerophilales bacterium]|nr:aspartate--tRNA ligase [Candidatus Gastranaerophilales bacterium]
MITTTSMKTHGCGEITKNEIGKEITIAGWVSAVRDLGGIIFVEVRDRSGLFQLVSDPQKNPEVYDVFQKLKDEFVIKASGIVSVRPEETYNDKLPTGEIEVYPTSIEILSASAVLPFPLNSEDVSEDVRLKYRYLDLRRSQVLDCLKLRHKIVTTIRNYLNEHNFMEVETPILIKTTPEGARDYLVPSRIQPGKFYALPQSPQIFKQLLMVGGIERYYQIAKCFRDEDLRADRQPEFTQVDMEMSFVGQQDIMNMVEGLLREVFKLVNYEMPDKLPVITYKEAMDRYGSDRPDTRFGLELFDIGDIIMESDFEIIKDTLKKGGIVRAIKIPGIANYSRKEIDDLTKLAVSFGAKALANILYLQDGSAKSPVLKFLTGEQAEQIKQRANANAGDAIFFVADKPKVVYDVMGRFRLYFGNKLNLINPDAHALLWVVDFPMFEYSEEDNRYVSVHHPFTMPNLEDIDKMESDPENCRSIAYDIVYNGNELGGGSVRIHSAEIQQRVFKALGLTDEETKEKFGFMINAFKYGTPPHAGLALGLDRVVALLAKTNSIRDVIAFPKNSAAKCLMTDAPAMAAEEQLRELHLKLRCKVN